MDPISGMGGGGLSPEQMRAYLDYVSGQGSFTEQDREIQRQMAAAQALRDQASGRHTTGIGGGLGAIGDALTSLAGARQMGQARNEDKLLQLARVAALRKMANAYNPQPDPGVMGGQMAPGGGAYTMPEQ